MSNFDHLSSFVKWMRKRGVIHMRCEGVELTLGEDPQLMEKSEGKELKDIIDDAVMYESIYDDPDLYGGTLPSFREKPKKEGA